MLCVCVCACLCVCVCVREQGVTAVDGYFQYRRPRLLFCCRPHALRPPLAGLKAQPEAHTARPSPVSAESRASGRARGRREEQGGACCGKSRWAWASTLARALFCVSPFPLSRRRTPPAHPPTQAGRSSRYAAAAAGRRVQPKSGRRRRREKERSVRCFCNRPVFGLSPLTRGLAHHMYVCVRVCMCVCACAACGGEQRQRRRRGTGEAQHESTSKKKGGKAPTALRLLAAQCEKKSAAGPFFLLFFLSVCAAQRETAARRPQPHCGGGRARALRAAEGAQGEGRAFLLRLVSFLTSSCRCLTAAGLLPPSSSFLYRSAPALPPTAARPRRRQAAALWPTAVCPMVPCVRFSSFVSLVSFVPPPRRRLTGFVLAGRPCW